jgi:NAD(P)-dependent dehydrogenase (short-subunit alcohol dehydrogenase family)
MPLISVALPTNITNMNKLIIVAGATGNLGEKICRELIKLNAKVKAIVRNGTSAQKLDKLKILGVEIVEADLLNQSQLTQICAGANCVVSALAGLHDVIVDTQLCLLNAAVAAGVPRFIPSDFCTDFTQIPEGENRNFDLRKEFQAHLDKSPIQATSVFNGAFADILRYNTPVFNVPKKTVAYYEGKEDWKIDFTTMDDTAAYTAAVALDDASPRFLNIASFSVSPNDLVALSGKGETEAFELVNMGPLEELSAYNKSQRAANPEGEKDLYPRWQQSQYIYSMFFAHHLKLDNERYEGLSWSPAEENISF